jgi:hypothetical protein
MFSFSKIARYSSSSTEIIFQLSILLYTVPTSIYCYHCHKPHSREEMRLFVTKNGKRWRCERSIQGALADKETRDAFGRQASAANKAEAQARIRMAAAKTEP